MDKTQLFAILKPIATSTGFNDKELNGFLDMLIAINPALTDEKTTEEEATEILKKGVPLLSLGQSQANRVQSKLQKQIDDLQNKLSKGSDNKGQGEPKPEPIPDDLSNKGLIELVAKIVSETNKPLIEQIEKLTSSQVSKSRKEQLEEIVKDSGEFGNTILSNFEMMNFESEDQFNEFLERTKTSAEGFRKEEAGGKLGNLNPRGGGTGGKPQTLTEEEMNEIIGKHN